MNPSFVNEETFTFPYSDWCTEADFLLVEAGNKKKKIETNVFARPVNCGFLFFKTRGR